MSTFPGEDRGFGPPKVQEVYNIIYFLIFDGKQHPKNMYLVAWMLKSPLTFVLKNTVLTYAISAVLTFKILRYPTRLYEPTCMRVPRGPGSPQQYNITFVEKTLTNLGF